MGLFYLDFGSHVLECLSRHVLHVGGLQWLTLVLSKCLLTHSQTHVYTHPCVFDKCQTPEQHMKQPDHQKHERGAHSCVSLEEFPENKY